MNATIGDLVLVEWVDAAAQNGWADERRSREQLDEGISVSGLADCETVGFLHHVGAFSVTVARDHDDNGHVSDGLTIPLCAIRNVWLLEPA